MPNVSRVGPDFQAGISTQGATAGTTGLVNGQVLLVGASNVTLSQSVNGSSATLSLIALSTTPQSVQPGIAAIQGSGAASQTTGTVQFANSNGLTFGLSTGTGVGTITGSYTVPTQSVQTQNLHNVTLSGNTAGVMAQVSSGTLSLAGGNNVTLSQAGNAVTISGAGTSAFSGGASTIGNTSGNTGTVSNQLVLAGGNNITLSQSTNAAGATLTISGPNVGGAQTGISSVAASGGTQTVGMVSFANSNGLTFGMSTGANTGTVTASYTQSTHAHSDLSAGMSTQGNTSGTTGLVANQLILAGGNNVTLSQSVNGASATLTISAANQTVQTQNLVDVTLSGNTAGVMALISSGTLTLAGGNNITVSQNGNAVTISGPNAGGAQTGISSVAASGGTQTVGMVSFINSNSITFGMSTGANTGSITASFSQSTHAHTDLSAGMSTQGNTSGTTGLVANQLILAGGNNITLSQSVNGQSATLTISGPNTAAQTVQTQNMFDLVLSTTAGGATTGTMATVSSGTITLFAGNNITLSQSGTQTIVISGQSVPPIATAVNDVASAGSTGTVTRFAPEDHRHAGLNSISVVGNTAGNTSAGAGSLVLAGGPNITISGSTAAGGMTLSVSGGAGGGGGGAFTGGLSNIGNTSGDTVTVTGRIVFAGGNNITLSGSSNGASQTITISAFNESPDIDGAGISNIGNTSGTSGTGAGTLILVGGNDITLSQSTAVNARTVTISAQGGPNMSFWKNAPDFVGPRALTNEPANSLWIFPLMPNADPFAGRITISTLELMFSGSSSTANSQAQTLSVGLALYTLTGSTLSLLNSVVSTIAFAANSTIGSNFHGMRWFTIHSSLWSVQPSLSASHYWGGYKIGTSGSSQSLSVVEARAAGGSVTMSGTLGAGAGGTNSTQGIMPFYGGYTSSYTAVSFPASIQNSEIQRSGSLASGGMPLMQFNAMMSH